MASARRTTKPGIGAVRPDGREAQPPTVPPVSGVRGPAVACAAAHATVLAGRPRPLAGRKDLRSIPLAPRDVFVLSRVDGTLSVEDLADLTGIPSADAASIVRRLVALGLVVLEP